VPELFVAPDDPLAGRFPAETAWLRRCHDAGATIAATCSGALLLAEAGLLDGHEATTHWAFCDTLARRYPRVKVHAQRALVVSGDGQRLVLDLRASLPHLPIVIASGRGPDEIALRADPLLAVVAKPYEVEGIVRMVEAMAGPGG